MQIQYTKMHTKRKTAAQRKITSNICNCKWHLFLINTLFKMEFCCTSLNSKRYHLREIKEISLAVTEPHILHIPQIYTS